MPSNYGRSERGARGAGGGFVPGGEARPLDPDGDANLYRFAILPSVALLAAVFVYLWGYGALSDGSTFERPVIGIVAVYAIGFLVVAFGIAAHEAIHGFSWAYFGGKPMSVIKFGFQVETLTPYAHCKESIEARGYRIGATMPGLVVGLLPSLVGIATGNGWIMLFGLFFTFAAGGDLLILWLIRKVDAKALVEDHPTNAGCYVYERRQGRS